MSFPSKAKFKNINLKPKVGKLSQVASHLDTKRLSKKIALYKNRYIYINCVAIILCAYLAADLVLAIMGVYIPNVEPIQPISKKISIIGIQEYSQIFKRNLFNKDGLIPDIRNAIPDVDGTAVKSSLPLDLLGVIILQDRLKSIASVNDRKANTTVAVRINEPMDPDLIIYDITDNQLIFINKKTNRKEYIEIPEEVNSLPIRTSSRSYRNFNNSSSSQEIEDKVMKIDREEVNNSLKNIKKIMRQARCIPNNVNGQQEGYRCMQIKKGSIYDKLGLKNNDIIYEINGESLNDPSKAFELFYQLKSADKIELSLQRGSKKFNMIYNIE